MAAKLYELNCFKKDYPASCFNLGRLKLASKGVEQNDFEALNLFGQKNHAPRTTLLVAIMWVSCTRKELVVKKLVLCQYYLEDLAKALAAFKKACEYDDANSCNHVATLYLSPRVNSPFKRNIQQAKTYLEKACDANFAPACHNLAVMYKKGDESVTKDEAKYEEYRAKTEKLVEQAGGMSSIKST
ncbi:hypothetical protein PsorP6_000280 [Peronosclerospora sorghi]|uniref:Uncharacterized protein n=1 Tax=Peronosclerospora sorghi TaxID=230839 RepID=A0ACC0WUJ3_9STRA|nr:hypothetical protein PsorP6_000280 [Peronosclerospora sorghi]